MFNRESSRQCENINKNQSWIKINWGVNMDNSRMIIVIGPGMGGKSYVQELLNKISNNVDVVIADELSPPPENDLILVDDCFAIENVSLELKAKRILDECDIKVIPYENDNSFRGGSLKKGGKTKYKRN